MTLNRTPCPECGSPRVWRMLIIETHYFWPGVPAVRVDVWQCEDCWAEWEIPDLS